MGRLPNLGPLFFFALVGILATALVALGALGWVGYHVFMALSAYLGA